MQPLAYQGWLEHSKMEEECGNQSKCRRILRVGLKFSPFNENLFVKALKVEEKLKNYDEVRKMLATLKDSPIERTWKMVMEGALFEGRCCNSLKARKAFAFLVKTFPTYGPIYLEASKFEEREGNLAESIKICEDGRSFQPKYGPLWF